MRPYYYGVSSDPNNLQHWKYIRKYKKNGKWRYVYNKPSNKPFSRKGYNFGSRPESYKPENHGTWEKTTMNGKTGYVDDRGMFYAGDYKTAAQKKWETEAWLVQKKAEAALEEARYNSSFQKVVDDFVRGISESTKKLSDFASSTVDKGRNAVGNMLIDIGNKIKK